MVDISIAEKAKNNFKLAVNRGRVPHAILIEGGSELVRLETAWFFAKSIVCSGEDKPCNNCKNCKKTNDKMHPDIIEIKGGENARSFHIEEIRKLKSDAYILPNEADKKVFILINSQNMSEQAQNALLKILEEPPEQTIIILTCDSRISILQTVLSRVVTFDLGAVEDESITDEKKQKAKEISSEIIKALCDMNEFEVLKATGSFEKDKYLFTLCIDNMLPVVRDALRIKNGSENFISTSIDEARILSLKFTVNQLMEMMQSLTELKEAVDKNANNSILITRLCSEMGRISGI